MSIASVMTKDVVTVAPDTPLEVLAARMRDLRLSCVVVCEDGRPVGIVSERDIVRALGHVLAHTGRPTLRACDVMSSPVFALDAASDLDVAVRVTAERGFRRVPIVDEGGRIAGLLTQSDLLRAHVRALEDHRVHLEATVAARTASLVEANRRLEEICMTDALMEIGNRRAMAAALDQEHDRASRYRRPYAVVLFDVDHFKKYNDRYGHQAGDSALREIARRIDSTRRSTDSVHRYGGEEIILVLPESTSQDAQIVAERALGQVAQMGLEHASSEHGVVTLSAGVACVERHGRAGADWAPVVESADEALYRAKNDGRNRVVV
jgi:diguanylate cyclase (GGDEF)-like protein